MPIAARIEESGRIYIRASGLVTYEDLRNYTFEREARPILGSPQLFDARDAQTDLTVEQIQSLLNTVRDQFERGEIGPTAIVAHADSLFAQAHVYQSYSVGHATPVRIFNDIAAAEQWLSNLDTGAAQAGQIDSLTEIATVPLESLEPDVRGSSSQKDVKDL